MSASTTTTPSFRRAGTRSRTSLLRWIFGGLTVAAILAAVTIAVWPESATDKARADGEQVGQAVADLRDAQSVSEADAALADLRSAVRDTRIHAGDAVAGQADDQADALSRAVDGFVGVNTTDSEWDADLYQSELDVAVDDLTTQADDFRAEGPEVQQAFWDGVDNGLNGN
jgi:hypothetical protein